MTTIRIDDSNAGGRLDRLIRKAMPHTPLAAIFGCIRKGQVTVNGKKKTQDYRLVDGDVIEIRVEGEDVITRSGDGSAGGENILASNFFKKNFKIVFEDDDLLILEKPIGIVVHSGAGHLGKDALIDLATAYLTDGGRKKGVASLVHRLDRDTSGIILLAKNKAFLRELTASLESSRAEKVYRALCHGSMPEREGIINLSLARLRVDDDQTKVVVDRKGQEAKTGYKVIGSGGGLSLIEATLFTGRTHQIRVHLSHLGCPIVGDRLYGDPVRDEKIFAKGLSSRLYLHAYRIAFMHPRFRREVSFEVPPPESFNIPR